MGNSVDTVDARIRNAILTAYDGIIAPEIELSVRSVNASPGRDPASVTVNSGCMNAWGIGISASFENVCERNDTLIVLNTNFD